MHILASDAAAAVKGRLVGPDIEFDGATQDSRDLIAGQLFVPVVAERDGHEFIAQALAGGAAAYLTSHDTVGGTAIEVTDTVDALQRLGRLARGRLDGPVVAITGSVGKTSTKDLIASALAPSMATHASEKSFNNELGVPLTLLNAPDDTAVAVLEMGSRGAGDIRFLCDIAGPEIGVVTSVGMVHTSEFGSFAAVIDAKAELVEALPSSGIAVLNAEIAEVAAMAQRTAARSVTFGVGVGDVRAVLVEVANDLTSTFRIESDWDSFDVRLGARGEHNVANAAAAAAVALILGVSRESIVGGLASPRHSPWRMELSTASSGLVVVNDAYNANPLSVSAALRALADLPARRRVAVLAIMAELGEVEAEEHARIGALAVDLGIEVIAISAPAYNAPVDVDDQAGAIVALGDLGEGDAVLVKGSRVAALELLAAELIAGD
ncbi:MAG: UDP-N-acetylmuramoyl-tripeptide--D-alanyl-D-alanine ligase [Acidimicrobiales bacterium]